MVGETQPRNYDAVPRRVHALLVLYAKIEGTGTFRTINVRGGAKSVQEEDRAPR